jgi:kinesin family protein 6/9
LSNLSEHKAQNEEDALNLLFIGDTNRVVCETPKNDASTRSHCIFIVQIEASQVGSDIKTVSRLHLVDLSGSERVGKTGVDGKLLQEARYINLSLHYLEHVIICLNKKAKGENVHIPYRNSLMTLVLRDSLGGNCKTRMVATMSAEEGDIDESISTCHFAARVALIKNTISRNEAVDPGLIIERLKKENAELKAELALLKGGNQKDNLDSADIEECKKIVEDYVKTKDPSVHIVLSDRLKINECFYHFKHLFNDLARKYDKDVISGGGNKIKEALNVKNEPADLGPMTDELKRLKLLVQQRDNEIMILLNMINKNKLNDQSMAIPVERDLKNTSTMDIISKRDYDTQKPITFPKFQADLEKEEEKQDLNTSKMSDRSDKAMKLDLKNINYTQGNLNGPYGGMKPNTILPSPMVNMPSTPSTNANSSKEVVEVNSMLITPLNLTTEQLMDRASCFEIFRKSYRKNEALEENKELLKEKFAKGKELGPLINNARNACNRIKNQIEELRKEAAVQGLVNNDNAPIKHPDEDKLTTELEKQKLLYKRSFEELKDLKEEIQRIQNLIERNREKLQKDFEKWIEVMMNQKSALNSTALPTSKTSVSYATSHAPNNALNQISLNQSITSTLSSTTKKVDPEVQKNLQAFYKARDDIYKQTM